MKKLLLSLLLTAHTVMAAPPVTVVVPNPPGGFTDVFGRAISRYLAPALGQEIVVLNRGGADGRVAIEYMVNQTGPGLHLLVAASGTILFNKVLLTKLNNDYTAFDHMVPMVRVDNALVVHPKTGVNTVEDLVALSRTKSLNCAGGAASHVFAGKYIMQKLTIRGEQWIPFKGSSDLTPQLLSGNIECAVDSMVVLNPHIKDQRLKILAISSPTRSASAPTQTLFTDLAPGVTLFSWAGISVLKTVPQAEKDRVFAALRSVHQDPNYRATVLNLGLSINENPHTDIAWLHNEYNRLESIRQQIGMSKID
jgi:tripartite-type tricarboxylate transporter receptor subunit TctC